MAGLVPAIHVFAARGVKDVAARIRGHDGSHADRHFAGFFQILRFCISATCLSITSRL
jgi:hypothetical protein